MSASAALRLSIVALILALLCSATHAAVFYFHAPLAIPPRVLTFLGIFGLTWPLWGYAVAMYRRALSAK